MELKLKDPSLTARDNQISSIKSRLSVSPTSTLPSARYENDRRIKKKFKSVHSKISVDQDIRVLTDYIEDLSS